MSKKDHHHGENIHKLEQVPERPSGVVSPDLLKVTKGNRSPAEVKRIRGEAAKRHGKNESAPKQTQT